MMRRRHTSPDDADINITPLLDIVFIMLIFFIVTTSFVKEVGLDLDRPTTASDEPVSESKIIAIRIDYDGTVLVQDRVVDIRAVRANVESALAVKPNASVVVIADSGAEAGLLVSVIDQARLAGAEKVSVAKQAG